MKPVSIVSDYETKTLALIFLSLQFVVLFGLFYFPNPLWAVLALCSLLILPFIITSPNYILFLTLFYIIVFPVETWGDRYDFFKVYVDWKLVILLLAGTVVIFYIRFLFEKRWKFQWYFLDKIILIFLVYVFINTFWGIYQNGQIKSSIYEFYNVGLYGVYFLARLMMNDDDKWIIKFFILFVVATTIAAIQYISLTFSQLDITAIFINRVTTQQPHLAQISIPFLTGAALFLKRKTHKVLSLLLLIPNLLMVIFSQQRALYVATVLTLLIVLFLYYTRNGFKPVKLFNFSLSFLFLVFLLIGFLVVMQKYFNLQFILTVAERIETMQDVSSDESWRLRFGEVAIALEKWKNHVFLGNGLGSTFPNTFLGRSNKGVDNSYAFVLWKLGIWGLLMFLTIYVIFFIQGIKTFWVSSQVFEKLIISTIVSGMLGVLLVAVTNMCIIQYRFNMIWAIGIAIIQHYYIRKVRLKDV